MNVTTPTGLWKNETEHFATQDEVNAAILAYIPQYAEDGFPISAQFAGFLDFNREDGRIRIPHKKYGGDEGADREYACGAGCRACACGETKTDYLGIDEEASDFFLHGWYEKAQEVIEQYGDRFGKLMKANE